MAPIQEGTRCCCKELAVGPPQPLSFTPALQSCISHLPLCTRGTGAGRGPLQKGGGGTLGTGGPGPALGPLRVLPALSLEQKRDF